MSILLDGLAGEWNPEQCQYLEIGLRNVKQLHSMINDLFEVSGMQAGKLKIELQCSSVAGAIAHTVNTLKGAAAAKAIIMLPSDIERKLLQEGADADIVVFDAATISDRSTFAKPMEPSVGVRYLLVAGTVVVDERQDRTGCVSGPCFAGAWKALSFT